MAIKTAPKNASIFTIYIVSKMAVHRSHTSVVFKKAFRWHFRCDFFAVELGPGSPDFFPAPARQLSPTVATEGRMMKAALYSEFQISCHNPDPPTRCARLSCKAGKSTGPMCSWVRVLTTIKKVYWRVPSNNFVHCIHESSFQYDSWVQSTDFLYWSKP